MHSQKQLWSEWIVYANSPQNSAPAPAAPTGKKVAVVGAETAGLVAAYHVALLGHKITIFEQKSIAGGMMAHLTGAKGCAQGRH